MSIKREQAMVKTNTAIDAIEDHLQIMRRGLNTIRCTCLSCYHFDEPTEICNKYKQRPPARVIVHGCVDWDDIPF